jgi:hypothetical protein
VTVAAPVASSIFVTAASTEVARLEQVGRRGPARPGVAGLFEIGMIGTDAQTRSAGLGRGHHDRGNDVARPDRPQPSIVLESFDRVLLVEDVARRAPPAVALVVGAQSVLERAVGEFLQPRIERRPDVEAVLVQHFGAVVAFEMLADFLDEERRDARRLRRRAARDDRLRLGGVSLRLRDVAFVGQPLQHDVAALGGAPHVHERTLPLRRLEDAGNQRRFVERELLVRFVEIQPRRRLDTVGAVAEVHLVAVDREDFFLGVALLDLNRKDDLAHLALEQLLLGQAEVIEVARHLLSERARALVAAPFDDIGRGGGEDAPDVDAEVLVEFGVLGRDDRVT